MLMTDQSNDNPRCVTACNDVKHLFERVDRLEDRVEDMRVSINNIDTQGNVLEAVLCRLETAFEKNIQVMNSMGDTLASMRYEIKTVGQLTSELKVEIGGVKKKFDEAEEKNKIDIRLIIKEVLSNKIIWLLGIATAIFEIVRSNFDNIKNFLK